jgi:hypothetical protein
MRFGILRREIGVEEQAVRSSTEKSTSIELFTYFLLMNVELEKWEQKTGFS